MPHLPVCGDAETRVSTGSQASDEPTLAHNAMRKRELSFKVGIQIPDSRMIGDTRFVDWIDHRHPRVTPDTLAFPQTRDPTPEDINSILFNRLTLAPRLPFLLARTRGLIMETMLQGLVIIGGLTFSLAASLLIEELIFGRIVRLAFARRPESSKHFSEHAQKN